MAIQTLLTLTLLGLLGGGTGVPDKHLHTAVKGRWEADANLVTVRGGALARFAQKDYWAAETKRFDNFAAYAREDFKKGTEGMAGWSFDASSEIMFNTRNVVSIRIGCYEYMGGAHGIGVSRTYNYGMVNGKPKRLSLWDVLQKSRQSEVRLLLLGKAAANEGTDWVQDGTINSFTDDQYQRFWISKDAIGFEFDPYELGSYASGPFTFRLTFQELKGVIRKDGPLKGR